MLINLASVPSRRPASQPGPPGPARPGSACFPARPARPGPARPARPGPPGLAGPMASLSAARLFKLVVLKLRRFCLARPCRRPPNAQTQEFAKKARSRRERVIKARSLQTGLAPYHDQPPQELPQPPPPEPLAEPPQEPPPEPLRGPLRLAFAASSSRKLPPACCTSGKPNA